MSDPRELLDAYASEFRYYLPMSPLSPEGARGPAKSREDVAPKAFAALRAVLDLHPAGYAEGEPEYGYHWQTAQPSGHMVEVRNAEPNKPYYCERCQEFWPCETAQAITAALEEAQ